MSDADLVDSVLVSRLYQQVDPFHVLGWIAGGRPRLETIMRHSPLDFVPLSVRSPFPRYDYGRISFFVRRLRAKDSVEPIELDCFCDRHHIYPEVVVLDGHHRFCAHLLLQKRRLPVLFSGRIDVLEWLRGERRLCPEE